MEHNRILVDTSIFIDHFRKKYKNRSAFYKIIGTYDLYTSTVVEFELFLGATDSIKQKDVNNILKKCTILPFTSKIAQQAATIYQELKRKNTIIEIRDVFIASTAIEHDLPLITFNTKHFSRIDGLRLLSPFKK